MTVSSTPTTALTTGHVGLNVVDLNRSVAVYVHALGLEVVGEGSEPDPDGTRLEIYAPSGVEGAPAPSGQAPTCGFF